MNLNLGRNRCCLLPFKRDNIGPQGDQGNIGQLGEIGLTGSTGATGFQGATGLCYRGYKGPQGARGLPGGLVGPRGAVGPSGIIVPTTNSLNTNFSFITNDFAFYDSNPIDLTSYAFQPINNTITPTLNTTYSIKWSFFGSWTDSNSNFAVRFKNGSTSYPFVFTNDTPSILNTNGTFLCGIGNDIINLTNTTYTIELIKWTTSENIIDFSNRIINFSITLIPLS